MPKLRTVCLSNAFPPDPRCGEFAAAAFSMLENVASRRAWKTRLFCGKFEAAVPAENFFPTLSRMEDASADARLWRGYRTLSANSVAVSEAVSKASRRGNAFLILNPTGLSAQEWTLALAQAQAAIPWVDSDWPRDFPACDPFWTLALRHRHSFSPPTLIAAALVRSLYGEISPAAETFCGVRAALFASETLRERNVSAFPNLERSAVIPPAVDGALFPFAETSAERARVWGWNGGFSETSGVLVALDAFASQLAKNPDARMILAGDADSRDAGNLRAKIAGVPALAPRVEFVGKIPRERLAQDFFRRVGLYVHIPKDESAFPTEAAEAMSCGCLVFGAMTEEMKNVVPAGSPLLFNARAPETARLLAELVARMSAEEWALTAADGAARVQELFSPSRTEEAFADFIEAAAAYPEDVPAQE